jgi:nucleoside phosphorylase
MVTYKLKRVLMKLIYVALKQEAKPIIEYFKLTCKQVKPYKIYEKNDIVLVICGMGKKNTLKIKTIFEKYDIKMAINIGIAGCKDRDIQIGTMFCTNHKLKYMNYTTLTTVDTPIENEKDLTTTLVDMEAEVFLSTCKEFLDTKNIYILKVVSDYLDTSIPKKEFVWKIIEKNLKNISKIVTLRN